MVYQVFLSYSRVDAQTSNVVDFHDELNKRLRAKIKGISKEEAIFFDVNSIELATDWTEKLEEALRTSRYFVALVSPNYVASTYCGKEWETFRRRVAASNGDKVPPLMMPLIWEPLTEDPPAAIRSKQWSNAKMPAEYTDDGLSVITQLTRYKDQLFLAAEEIATRIEQEIRRNPIPEGPALERLATIPSAFHPVVEFSAAAPTVVPMTGAGPTNARFLYVAATPKEIEELRRSKGADAAMLALRQDDAPYGDDSGLWQPYLPDETEAFVAKIASDEAWKLRLRPNDLPLTDDVAAVVRQAAEQNNLVAVVVDPCSLELDRYKVMMSALDKFFEESYTILIAWNKKDQGIANHQERLGDLVRITFRVHSTAANTAYFHPRIDSLGEFRDRLSDSLAKLRSHVHDTAVVARKVEVSKAPVVSGPGAV